MTTTAVAEAVVTEIALVDLSSIAYPAWHMSGSQPDPDWTSQQIVERVRALTTSHPKAAICCDSGRSFRHDLSPTYKANRPEKEAVLYHQIALAKERLAADGYPVWSVNGFEADDLIASATATALSLPDTSVLVLSADKDLLQLVGPRVRAISVTNGQTYDADAVVAKFGVRPDQMRDYLCLVGDASDNVKGASGIGPKRAADLLSRYDSIEGVYAALKHHATQFTPALATSLQEFRSRWATVQALITLQTAAAIPFADLDGDRVPSDVTPLEADEVEQTTEIKQVAEVIVGAFGPATSVTVADTATVGDTVPVTTSAPAVEAPKPAQPAAAPAIVGEVVDTLAPAPADWNKQLEPRSMREVQTLAKLMFDSRMFAGYGTPHAVLSTIMVGRELGLQAMASLRAVHVVEGKHCLAADLLRALVIRSGKAKYFRCSERTAERATFVTQREGEPEMTLTYTIEEAQQAGLVKEKSGWMKNPADMLVARAGAKLARLVYPEVVHGLYAREEFDTNV